MSIPDYTYPYSRAVEERVCRPTAFFTYGGEVSWTENGRVGTATFGDALDTVNSARRLRAALDPDSGWIQPLLKDAHAMLTSVRAEHPRAGGLIVCADQTHSRQIAKLLTSITGERPCVVLSDDSGASKKIKEFSNDASKWLVACNMVSEGVDIPRLRIGVYATTVRTKMYFRQFLGRVVRREADIPGHQVAYVYLPADPNLHEFAEEVESETRHLLNAPHRKERDEELDRRNDNEKVNTWSPLSSVNSGVDAVILHGNQLTLFGGVVQAEEVKRVINQELDTRLEVPLTRSEKKLELATTIKHLVGLFHKRSGKPHSVIHTTLNQRQSVRSQTHCTEKQLEDRIFLLETMLKSAERGVRRGVR
jgi:superfamily II DNA or RNA helicase